MKKLFKAVLNYFIRKFGAGLLKGEEKKEYAEYELLDDGLKDVRHQRRNSSFDNTGNIHNIKAKRDREEKELMNELIKMAIGTMVFTRNQHLSRMRRPKRK